jgi:hypothetical protein
MGLYDRDYMRRDDRPPPSPGGRLGLAAFLLILLAFAIHLHRSHPQFLNRVLLRPLAEVRERLKDRTAPRNRERDSSKRAGSRPVLSK